MCINAVQDNKTITIISGGQTGADRAAIDFAIAHNFPHGGWVPKGRKAEDGIIPDKYQLQEMATGNYDKRTEKNVLNSDGTLIVSHGELAGGSALTRELAGKHKETWIHIDLGNVQQPEAARLLTEWIEKNHISIMNVAGPRKSKDAGIYQATFDLLTAALIHSDGVKP